MENQLRKEQLDFVCGQVAVLKDICCGMAAMHPYRSVLSQLAKNVRQNAVERSASAHYVAGIEDILEALEAMVNSAVIAELAQRQGPDTKLQ